MMELKKSPVVFHEDSHTYWLGDKQLYGVTNTLLSTAFPDKYDNVPQEMLSAAAERGHQVHEMIEFYDRFGGEPDTEQLVIYEHIKQEHGLTTVENEYLVSDCERYASQIDIVMQDTLGGICLVDTKTTYNLDRRMVAMQLSIYKRFFERQNPGLTVDHLYALWLPFRDLGLSKLVELSPFSDETIDALIKADKECAEFVLDPVPDEYAGIESRLRHWQAIADHAGEEVSKAKQELMELMKASGIDSIKSGYCTVSYIPARTSSRFDQTVFKKENPDIYKNYLRETETKEQIRITPKKQQ